MTKEQAFPLPLDIRYQGFRAKFKLLAPFQYRNGKDKVDVPVEAKTDGGSIPPAVYSIIGGPWSGRYVEPVVVHDYTRSIAITPEDYKNSDRMLLDGMKICKVAWWRRRVMWRFVRAHAWWSLSRKSSVKKAITLLLLLPLLSGCTLLRISTLKADGKDIGGAYALVTGNAKRMDLIGIGYTVITTEQLTEELLNKLPKVLIRVDQDNKVKEIGINND